MLDTSQDLRECASELGVPVEQFHTPLTRYLPQYPDEHFAIDNGLFSPKCDIEAFRRLLDKHWERRELCRFVTAPDIVASARRTLEAFEFWKNELVGWRIALVAQDGIEHLPIPWAEIDAIFIGGSTEWKMSKHATDVIRTAKILGKWAHVGRVNTPGRFEHFERAGADSIDGTGLSRYTHMREKIYESHQRPPLFQEIA